MANKAAKSTWEKAKILVAPTMIGVYITIVFVYIAFNFYRVRNLPEGTKGLARVLNDIDQKSVDYRLIFRGRRAPDPRVAVLAVDDRSINLVGRWPWPRQIMAKALQAAYDHGAKVIAADVVWSEPTDRPEVRLLSKLTENAALPPASLNQINQLLVEADDDRILAEFIARNQSRFILGNFFEHSRKYAEGSSTGYVANCLDISYANSPLAKIIDSQERPVIVAERIFEAPAKLADFYRDGVFKTIEEQTLAKLPPAQSAGEFNQYSRLVQEKKNAFCFRGFLQTEGDYADEVAKALRENWSELAPEFFDGKIPASSFDEWINSLAQFDTPNAIPETLDWTINIPKLYEGGVNHGYFNAVLDGDGVIRRAQLIARTGNKYMPSISLLAYLVAHEYTAQMDIASQEKLAGAKGVEKLIINDADGNALFTIPTDYEGNMMINYAGPGRMIPHASMADLLDDKKTTIEVTQHQYDAKSDSWRDVTSEVSKDAFFKDRILVWGATAIGVFDLRNTPFDGNFPGVETHANVIDNLLRQDFLRRSPHEDLNMPLFMLIIGIALSALLAHVGALPGMLLTLGAGAAMLYIDRQFLFGKGVVVSTGFPLIQTLFTYMALTFYKYFTEERSKKELRQTFSKYVSPQIVEEVLKDPKNLELGGRKERITVFFSDVRGFTTISEKLDPRELSDLLNSYLTPMTDLVFQNRGTLDKYMGDAIMAFFGAPIPMKDHAKWACRCALQHLRKLEELRAEYRRKGLPDIDIGIGLNTGECSVGNMGSQTVRNYTVMGDTVNLASRLEGINKTYGTRIIISEFTHADVQSDFTCREVDRVRVKGKNQPVRIFELVCEGKPEASKAQSLAFFQAGYELYHAMKFSEAVTQFQQAVLADPKDETAKIYIERCQGFLAEPPPAEWDGVYVMKTK